MVMDEILIKGVCERDQLKHKHKQKKAGIMFIPHLLYGLPILHRHAIAACRPSC